MNKFTHLTKDGICILRDEVRPFECSRGAIWLKYLIISAMSCVSYKISYVHKLFTIYLLTNYKIYGIIFIENKKGCVSMLKKIVDVLAILCGIFLLWIAISWIDVAKHNDPFDDDYKDYWKYNFFNLVFDKEGEDNA